MSWTTTNKRRGSSKAEKFFVGGLHWDTTEKSLRAYFERTYGNVTDVEICYDAGKPRGFGFVSLKGVQEDDVLGYHTIDGKDVEVKPAVPQAVMAREKEREYHDGPVRATSASGGRMLSAPNPFPPARQTSVPAPSPAPIAASPTPKVPSAAAIVAQGISAADASAPRIDNSSDFPSLGQQSLGKSRKVTSQSASPWLAMAKPTSSNAVSRAPEADSTGPASFPALPQKPNSASALAKPASDTLASRGGQSVKQQRQSPMADSIPVPQPKIQPVATKGAMSYWQRKALERSLDGVKLDDLLDSSRKSGISVETKLQEQIPSERGVMAKFSAQLFNSSEVGQQLVEVSVVPSRKQFKCVAIIGGKQTVQVGKKGVDLPSNSQLEVVITFVAEEMGTAKQFLVFKMKDGTSVGSELSVTVIDPADLKVLDSQDWQEGTGSVWSECLGHYASEIRQRVPSAESDQNEARLSIEATTGNTNVKAWKLPEKFMQSNDVVIDVGSPQMRNYKTRMHAMMYLEERQQMLDMSRYFLKGCRMEKVTSYMSSNGTMYGYAVPHTTIAIPGVSERRPSVMKYDMVLAWLESDKEREYEGVVKSVQNESITVLFCKDFHTRFGVSCTADVRFQFYRGLYRLQHQAIEDVVIERVFPQAAPLAPQKVKLDFFDEQLDSEQRSAVHGIMSLPAGFPPFMLFGPFGSGKTRCITEVLRQAASMRSQPRSLVCCPSNSAADLLVRTLLKHGVPSSLILRVVAVYRSKNSVHQDVQPCCLWNDAEGKFSLPDRNSIIKHRIVVSTFTGASIVAANCQRSDFHLLILDEAAQATEPEALIPLSLVGDTTRIILSGDPRQLGGIVRSEQGLQMGLSQSLMERLASLPAYKLEQSNITSASLRTNYRSHPGLLSIASKIFYQSVLKAGGSSDLGTIATWSRLPDKQFPMLGVFVSGEEKQSEDSPSFFNPYEASECSRLVEELVQNGMCDQHEIAVVAGYNKQIEMIRLGLRQRGLSKVYVHSVEDIQGQEFKAVVVSVTRTDAGGARGDAKKGVGFVGRSRALNTAITRAQSLVVIVTDPAVAEVDPCLRRLCEACKVAGSYMEIDPEKQEKQEQQEQQDEQGEAFSGDHASAFGSIEEGVSAMAVAEQALAKEMDVGDDSSAYAASQQGYAGYGFTGNNGLDVVAGAAAFNDPYSSSYQQPAAFDMFGQQQQQNMMMMQPQQPYDSHPSHLMQGGGQFNAFGGDMGPAASSQNTQEPQISSAEDGGPQNAASAKGDLSRVWDAPAQAHSNAAQQLLPQLPGFPVSQPDLSPEFSHLADALSSRPDVAQHLRNIDQLRRAAIQDVGALRFHRASQNIAHAQRMMHDILNWTDMATKMLIQKNAQHTPDFQVVQSISQILREHIAL